MRIKEDLWLPEGLDFKPTWRTDVMMVSQLVWPEVRMWNVDLLRSMFVQDLVDAILRLPVPNPFLVDKWIWTKEKSGIISVKSLVIFEHLRSPPDRVVLDVGSWEKLWRLKLQDRLKLTLWKVASGVLKTRGNLARILHCEDEAAFQCHFCKQYPEDTIHLLVRCSVAAIPRRESPWAIPMDSLDLVSPRDLIYTVLNADSVLRVSKACLNDFSLNAAIVIDSLWFLRNKIIHEEVDVDVDGLVGSIRKCFAEHASAWINRGGLGVLK